MTKTESHQENFSTVGLTSTLTESAQMMGFDLNTQREIIPGISERQNNNAVSSPIIHPSEGNNIALKGSAPESTLSTRDIVPNTVFPPDDRRAVHDFADTASHPWSTIVRVETDQGVGSGVLIGGHYVLTAGHVIYDHERSPDQRFNPSVTVSAGYDQENGNIYRPYGVANATRLYAYPVDYGDNGRLDIGVIVLDRNLGNHTGYLGLQAQSDSYFNGGNNVHIAGYPGREVRDGFPHPDPDNRGWNTHIMAYVNGETEYESGDLIYSYLDTWAGMSGSPVYRRPSGTNDRYVVAVHTASSRDYSIHTQITSNIFNDLQNIFNSNSRPIDLPDLVDYDAWFNTSYASFSSSSILPGEYFTAGARIRNNGTATAGAFTVSFYASTNGIISSGDYFLGSVTSSSLSPFSQSDMYRSDSFPNIPAGSYYLGWIIDPDDRVREFVEDYHYDNDENYNTGVLSSQFRVLPPTITLSVSPATVSEDGTNILVYTFTRNGSTSSSLNNVSFNIGGTATFNNDYTQRGAAYFTGSTGTINFAPGSSTVSITVDPTADNIGEPDETVSFTLASGSHYDVGTPSPVTGTITNDEPTVDLSVVFGTVSEDGTTNLVYNFTRSGNTSRALNNVSFRVGGTATFNNDYTQTGAASFTGSTGRVNFAQGSSRASVIVDPRADNIVETDETVQMTLSSGTGYNVGRIIPVTGTITNDDGLSVPSISVNDVHVVEGIDSNARFTVSLSRRSSSRIEVNYRPDNTTALANSDYRLVTGTLTFNSGETRKTVDIPLMNNNVNELEESFVLKLMNPSNAIIARTMGIGTISDTLTSSRNTTLPEGVENLTLTGTNNINGTGNGRSNIIIGNTRNNILSGASGNDTLTGGSGQDNFSYKSGSTYNSRSFGLDTITDFTNQDKIMLSKTAFNALQSRTGNGFSVREEFARVTSDSLVSDSPALIVYSSASNALFYNQNGTGVGLGSGSAFAILNGVTNLSASSFVITA